MVTSQDLKVRYVGDASGVQKSLGQIDKMHTSMGSKLRSFGDKLGATGRSLTMGLTLPLVGFGAVAVREFGDAQRVAAQTDAVLKSTGGAAGVTADHISKLSSKIGELAAVDNDAVQSGANMLLTFTNIRNEAGKGNAIFDRSVKTLQNMSSAMGTDSKSAAIQLGKALNDPMKGISALTRVGVTFTEQQTKQIAKMQEAGDVAGAQKVILAELGKEFGGSAAAAGEAATPVQRLSLTFNDLAENVGGLLMPMLSKLAGFVKLVSDKFNGLSPSAQKIVVTLATVAAAVGPVLIVADKLIKSFATVGLAFVKLGSFLMMNPWVLLIAATIALVIIIVKNWDTIKAFLLKVWNAIKSAAMTVWNAIKGVLMAVWRVIAGAVKTYFNIYKTVIMTAWRVISAVTKAAWNVIKAVVLFVWRAIVAYARFYWNAIKTVIINPVLFVRDKITTALKWISDKWRAVWTGIKSFTAGVWDGIKSGVVAGINFLISVVESGINSLIGLYNKIADAPVIGKVLPHIDPVSIGRLARGGTIARAGLGLVGERGPELLNLPAGARVTPAGPTRELMRRAQGTTVNLTVNVSGSVVTERELVETVRVELIKIKRRSGSLGF